MTATDSPFVRAEETLEALLAATHTGSLRVPEFQRELVLEDEWIKSLLGSVSQNCPIGAVTLLETGSIDVRFEVRPVAGTPLPSTPTERLLLDGQHRIAALYQVLASGRAVLTENARASAARWYYVDIEAALDVNADRDEAMSSALDCGTDESEWEQSRFPLRLVFGADEEREQWTRGFVEHRGGETDARTEVMRRFESEVIAAFAAYVIPTTTVRKERTRWAVRVHGGPEGRRLSDQFRVSEP